MCLLSLSIHLLVFCKLVQSANIRYFCENSMMAHAALVLKDTFTLRSASMQSILDSVDFFLENYEIILAKCSSSCVYILSLSSVFVVFIFCVQWDSI